ncbi:elongation factor 4 [Candidatus Peregrinibacteria bacterium CG_4_10_14_0_2_um_filter_38_24]|nr:MAG: elongation factor 4 [Candidatus Peregrinibacteria bacterium CG_4_10_14_0_2_um_filter_38_24]PJC38567.1 MAG: elongation factor 4 [Candidatus Peregrinibacteria bacterium CG_4_9_14_0_2_um_filter_38_9]
MNIRNFCIIAHIDHGKSTLADRFLEVTNTIAKRDMKHGQMLDTMELEQERGITIKLQPVRMEWEKGGEKYILNLIDTPGHVDFSYEVSRSLAACEGAILVVDATQGIEAQTLANCYMALDHGLEIIPVLNKIDLPSADVELRSKEIEDVLGISKDEIIAVSAKEGTNVELVLDRVIERIPAPKPFNVGDEFKALIFDSVYDTYKGVVTYVRVTSGEVKKGDKIYFLNTKTYIEVLEIGHFKPKYKPCQILRAGEVGYIVTGVRSVREARVGDTIWAAGSTGMDLPQAIALPGYSVVRPFVFAGVFCTDTDEYPMLREALDRLQLNDSSLSYVPEQSGALGSGFRCGFLGLLHMDIVQERLEREYDLDLIVTAPSVSYIAVTGKDEVFVSSPSELPDPSHIDGIKEPWVKIEVLTPKDYVGSIMTLCTEKRGEFKNMQYLSLSRVLVIFELPLASIVIDFYDSLKSLTSGYASMNYEHLDFRLGNLVKLDFLIAGEKVDALSLIVHRNDAERIGREMTKKLKDLIPREQFVIPIQAAIGAKVVARETVSGFRKDVTSGLYGGDYSRKRKLLEKQKKGKKRMKMMGKVNLTQEAFLAVLKKN